ncbi:MAG: hypothetical protein PSV35_01275, partial [bacterium]|nr:hypothetical protein [bacterium]
MNTNSLFKYLFLPCSVLIVLCAYMWIAYENSDSRYFHLTKKPVISYPSHSGYHQLLADAFLHGQLNLRVEPQSELLALPDPYDPKLNVRYKLTEATLFNGKYYLYFTPAVALLFELPFKVLFGYYISESLLLGFLGGLGFVFSVLSLRQICANANAIPSQPMQVCSIFVLATGSAVPLLLSNPLVYSLCIAQSYAFLMMALFFLIRASEQKSTHNKGILLFAGFLLGLCFISRPNQLFACALLVLAFFRIYYVNSHVTLRVLVGQCILLISPLLLIGLIMSGYNYARYHSLFEFGLTYQLNHLNMPQFHFASYNFIFSGIQAYLFQPFAIRLSWPFFYFANAVLVNSSAEYNYSPEIGLFFFPVFWLGLH